MMSAHIWVRHLVGHEFFTISDLALNAPTESSFFFHFFFSTCHIMTCWRPVTCWLTRNDASVRLSVIALPPDGPEICESLPFFFARRTRWFRNFFVVGYVEPVHKRIRLKNIPNHGYQRNNKEISLLANAHDNQFSCQVFSVVVCGDVLLLWLIVFLSPC